MAVAMRTAVQPSKRPISAMGALRASMKTPFSS